MSAIFSPEPLNLEAPTLGSTFVSESVPELLNVDFVVPVVSVRPPVTDPLVLTGLTPGPNLRAGFFTAGLSLLVVEKPLSAY